MLVTLLASTGGLIPTAPTVGTAVAANVAATVAFTASSYIGKGTITYTATSTPGNFTGTEPLSPLTILGLTNGTSYTFTVVGITDYGVSSEASAASNSVTPVAPAPPPPPPPPPPPGPPPPPVPPPPPPCSCASQPWPNNCSFVGYTCDGTYRYDYYDCGCSQTCSGTGGYNGAYRDGVCGYVTVTTQVCRCSAGYCVDNGCGGQICYDSCNQWCSGSACPAACPDCAGQPGGVCCPPASCGGFKDGYICI